MIHRHDSTHALGRGLATAALTAALVGSPAAVRAQQAPDAGSPYQRYAPIDLTDPPPMVVPVLMRELHSY